MAASRRRPRGTSRPRMGRTSASPARAACPPSSAGRRSSSRTSRASARARRTSSRWWRHSPCSTSCSSGTTYSPGSRGTELGRAGRGTRRHGWGPGTRAGCVCGGEGALARLRRAQARGGGGPRRPCKLPLHQRVVGPPGVQQRVVCPHLGDHAPREHDHPVGVPDCGEAVRHHNRGAPDHHPVQRLHHGGLALGVQRGGRLVEQQDLRVGEQGARDGHALLLPAAELHAALANLRVEPLRVGRHEARRVRLLECGGHLRLRDTVPREGEVLAERPREHHRLLAHEPERGVQVHRVDQPHVDAPE
mmetsp:Transcript_9897/g.34497  ORF Transcript_9897/g.34497 Transcript_9897/m.34497 type:complete len:305 (-) Transcript_9897:1465-2379(-)